METPLLFAQLLLLAAQAPTPEEQGQLQQQQQLQPQQQQEQMQHSKEEQGQQQQQQQQQLQLHVCADDAVGIIFYRREVGLRPADAAEEGRQIISGLTSCLGTVLETLRSATAVQKAATSACGPSFHIDTAAERADFTYRSVTTALQRLEGLVECLDKTDLIQCRKEESNTSQRPGKRKGPPSEPSSASGSSSALPSASSSAPPVVTTQPKHSNTARDAKVARAVVKFVKSCEGGAS